MVMKSPSSASLSISESLHSIETDEEVNGASLLVTGPEDDDDDDDEDADADIEDNEDNGKHSAKRRASQSKISPKNDLHEAERKEMRAIEDMAFNETFRVDLWRVILTSVLLITAVAITITTFYFLDREKQRNFDTAYDQLARTVGDAAVARQRELRDSLVSLSNSVTVAATKEAASSASAASSWPTFYLAEFESFGADFQTLSHADFVAINNFVSRSESDLFVDFVTEQYQEWTQSNHKLAYGSLDLLDTDTTKYNPFISMKDPETGSFVPDNSTDDFHLVRTTESPPPEAYGPTINYNVASSPQVALLVQSLLKLRNESLVSEVQAYESTLYQDRYKNRYADAFDHTSNTGGKSAFDSPHSYIYHPVYSRLHDSSSEIVATITADMNWEAYLRNLLPNGAATTTTPSSDGDSGSTDVDADGGSIVCVIRNDGGQVFTFELGGTDALYRGRGDLHDASFDEKEVIVDLSAIHTHPNYTKTPGHYQYKMHIYPTRVLYSAYNSETPQIFAMIILSTFCTVAIVFFLYDEMVDSRNRKIVSNAAKTNTIVNQIFPGTIRERLLDQQQQEKEEEQARLGGCRNNSKSLKAFLLGEGNGSKHIDGAAPRPSQQKPIADLFLETTIFFGDISGFTAWSSSREPAQVFQLLESVYGAFDEIARRRRIFKVETVGDCYVAVAGLPEPRPDHALAISRFARDCLRKMHTVVRDLEETLGPDTADLSLRIGLHSGAVTAGVLRGERSRFQLFGDTMNTASRMESTGLKHRIQVSEDTANLLVESGKSTWLVKRKDRPYVKGKGNNMQTYWLKVGRRFSTDASSSGGSSVSDDVDMYEGIEATASSTATTGHEDIDRAVVEKNQSSLTSERTTRLINWNAEMLLRLLKQIVARRNAAIACSSKKTRSSRSSSFSSPLGVWTSSAEDSSAASEATMPLDEVKEVIALPSFDSKVAKRQQDPDTVEIPSLVEDQLRDYVTCISVMYRANGFHNFDHASHVVMSVVKLMSRIIDPSDIMEQNSEAEADAPQQGSDHSIFKKNKHAVLHDSSYGITSDPLTQFACAFSALIHDVDHSGVPNPQLIEENPALATMYRNRSVAEQNSFDLSFNLLMDERFTELRAALFSGPAELARFRQLVINSVMATDLGDKELKKLRNARWEKAFKQQDQPATSHLRSSTSSIGGVKPSSSGTDDVISREAVNRKATIVIEHLIQASDVSHTMQHWHVYRKWNEKLFQEMYEAYLNGRAAQNPADTWYQGELGFFEFYVIPLAKKLKDCGIFGVSSDEYLNYAVRNHAEWKVRGHEIVAELVEKVTRNKPQNPITI